MPRLNATGSAWMGIAGITVSLDGSTPTALAGTQSGYWDWLDDTTGFGQATFDAGATWHLYTYDTGTDTLSAPFSSAEKVFTAAGGSVWATFTAGVGVQTSYGGTYPLALLFDVSELGQVTILQNAQTDQGIQVYDSTGALQLTLAALVDTGGGARVRGNILAYKDQVTGWQLVNVTTGQPVSFMAQTAAINWLVPVTMTDGRIALLERANSERVTLRYKDAQLGYVLTSTAVYFPDVIELSAGICRAAWSTTVGEGPADLQLIDLTLTNGVNSRGVVSGGTVVFSSRPALPTTSLPGTPSGPGGDGATGPLGAFLEGIYRQPMVEPNRIVTRPWYIFFIELIKQAITPVQAANIAGVLGPTQGGTGVTTGLTQLNANNLTMGNLPIARFNSGTNADATTFFRGDDGFGGWFPAGGGGGDVVGPASSVDGQVALFDGVTGKLLKTATDTGIAYVDAGVLKTCRVSVLTNGDPVSPELMWDSSGDVIMTTQVL